MGTADPALVTPEAAAAAGASVPAFHYIGLFAGGTKPKPFQRRRANLSAIVPDGETAADDEIAHDAETTLLEDMVQ